MLWVLWRLELKNSMEQFVKLLGKVGGMPIVRLSEIMPWVWEKTVSCYLWYEPFKNPADAFATYDFQGRSSLGQLEDLWKVQAETSALPRQPPPPPASPEVPSSDVLYCTKCVQNRPRERFHDKQQKMYLENRVCKDCVDRQHGEALYATGAECSQRLQALRKLIDS